MTGRTRVVVPWLLVLGVPAVVGVTRGDGRRFVVTVGRAAEAAALLTPLTARARG